ncbi:hypothetical protein LZC95_46055 [Pendulispora brunnea]|uniref:Cytochrome c domain-containing protein n=1 Tax=Pendulispora brunnea TaxID=2905690 RepID=A0ABZ2K530_9BACT
MAVLLPLASLSLSCGGRDAQPESIGASQTTPLEGAPPLKNRVLLSDDELAPKALKLLGGTGADLNCNGCHSITREYVRYWRALSDTALSNCLTDLQVSTPESARSMLACMRQVPTDPTSAYKAKNLGIYSTAVPLPWFEYLFKQAFGDTWETELKKFKERVKMPVGEPPQTHAPYTQEEFDLLAEWFGRGLPKLESLLPEDPAPSTCNPGISADVATHVSKMKFEGWRAVNAERGLLMHGCTAGSDPRDCLASYPRAGEQPYGQGWESLEGAKLRVLREQPYRSYYWTRSSPDGRFVAHGGSSAGTGSTIVDLLQNRVIGVNAKYDPSFFPDNSGFAFQGSKAFFCEEGLLTSGPANITFSEPQCSSNGQVRLYQHVGAALGGGDYWTVDSGFVSDDGGKSSTPGKDPTASFASTAKIRLTPMIHTGSTFEPLPSIEKSAPFEGDTVISPSTQWLVSRLGGSRGRQLGYVLRRLVATRTETGYTVETPEVARYCLYGGKPNFSFDERWMVMHHYIENNANDAKDLGYTGLSDPGFKPYAEKGGSNIYLVDVLTGKRTRVTKVQPGQYALFPHFRSDGWIYFAVRNGAASSTEYVVASDAALVLP